MIILLLLSSNLAFSNHFYPVTGTLHPKSDTRVSAQVAGRILEVYADIGDLVEKDQLLAKIDPLFFEMEYKRQLTLAELAQVSLEEADLNFTRMKNLWEDQERPSITKKQFDDASLALKQKKILLEQAKIDLEYSKKRLGETEIRAPYAGVITKRFVHPGEAVTVTPVVNIFEIVDSSHLYFEFPLPQEMLSKVKNGLQVNTKIEGLEDIAGKIETIYPQVDAASRCFKCRVRIDNNQLDLKPGLFVTAKIELE